MGGARPGEAMGERVPHLSAQILILEGCHYLPTISVAKQKEHAKLLSLIDQLLDLLA
jgi:hypothetical protein